MTRHSFQSQTTLILGSTFILQTLFISTPAFAQSAVRIAGQQVFQVNTGAGGQPVSKRVETIQTNLDNAIVASKDKGGPTIGISYVNGLPVITLAGYQVCTVDGADAKQAGTTPALLAQKWADSLRNALSDKQSVNSYINQLVGGVSTVASAAPPARRYDGSQASLSSLPPPSQDSGGADTYAGDASAPGFQGGARAYNPPYQQQIAGGTAYNGYAPAGGYGQAPGAPPYGPPPGYGAPPAYAAVPAYGGGPGYAARQGRVAYAPAGLVIPITLKTSISTQVAKSGDIVEAEISQSMPLGDGILPAGSAVMGTITDAKTGSRLSQSGRLSIKFNSIRTPDGAMIPISAHLTGEIGKYSPKGESEDPTIHGEGGKAKLGQALIRGGVGAGGGAALGTAVGAIAGGGSGAGRGAWSGAAIGGGLGLADMALRKGRDVMLPAGTSMKIQLDAPATVAGSPGSQMGMGNL